MIASLRGAGVEVIERHVPVWDGQRHKYSIGPRAAARLALSELELLLRPQTEFDVLVVGYPGHFDMPAARRIADGRPIVFNPLVSLEDTMVGDRRLVRSRSPLGKALHTIDRYAFRHADLVVADTAAHGRYLVEQFDLDGGQGRRLLRRSRGRRSSRPAPRSDGPFTVLFVGKFIPLHGVDVILEAARLAPSRLSDRWLGPARRASRRSVAERPLGSLDRVPRPSRAYHAAGCALGIFGRTEKAERVIPNKAFQAMATQTPLVTADTPAARELLEDGKNALLVPLGDPVGLADAIHRLAVSEDLRRTLGESGRATYLDRAE